MAPNEKTICTVGIKIQIYAEVLHGRPLTKAFPHENTLGQMVAEYLEMLHVAQPLISMNAQYH